MQPATIHLVTMLDALVQRSPHTPTSASLAAGLSRDTIRRWIAHERHPKVEELNKALSVYGYELRAVRKDTPSF